MSPGARRRLTAIAVTVVTVAGCAEHGSVTVDGVTLHVHARPATGGMAALVTGTLVGRDGCVLLEQDDGAGGTTAYPVVWPLGTRLVATEPVTLELLDGTRVTEGDRLTGGGGYLQPEHVSVAIDDDCHASSREVAVLNADSEITRDE